VLRALRRRDLAVLLTLAGCGERVDPFAADRDHDLQGQAVGPAHVSLRVGDALLLDIASAAIPPEPLLVQGPLGMPIAVTPSIEGLQLQITETEVCPRCVDVDIQAQGRLDLRTAILNASDIPWRAQVGAPLHINSDPAAEGLGLDAQWAAVPVRSTVQIEQGSATADAIVSGFVSGWLETVLTDALREPTRIATLGLDGVPFRDVRLTPDPFLHVQAHLALPVTAPDLPPPPNPENGWVLTLPTSVALAMARHHALRDSHKAYFIEPTTIDLDGATLNAQVRIWRAGRKAHYKSVRIEGIVSVREGDIILAPTHAETFASMAWRGGLDTAILGAKLRKWVEKGEIRLPATVQTPHGVIRVQQVLGENEHIRVHGDFSPTSRSREASQR
jgi:hypothetical protein